MVIQCKACSTKFRFDKSLVTGEGVWVRCSRCHNVFFQMSLPDAETKMDADTDTGKGREELFPQVSAEESKVIGELDVAEDIRPEDEVEEAAPPAPRKKSSLWMGLIGIIIAVIVVCCALLFIFPATGEMVVRQLTTVFPAIGNILPGSAEIQPVGPAQVKLVDLKQRFVENDIMGKIRVVEGMAVNTSFEPMTRIKVRAELYDVIGTPVRNGLSYCGNLLTDQELKTATEEYIVSKMSVPQGTDISNDRVTPKGMVPFMIIFLREPPGVTKTLVVPVEAERLLP
ncbi:MAG: zinc-ribbon domain-containing protein [Syntrophales bacterium]|nr:zinc-ribbon domain-containing protein [Syntrophales bacterium]